MKVWQIVLASIRQKNTKKYASASSIWMTMLHSLINAGLLSRLSRSTSLTTRPASPAKAIRQALHYRMIGEPLSCVIRSEIRAATTPSRLTVASFTTVRPSDCKYIHCSILPPTGDAML